MKPGDTPGRIVETYGRCDAATQMVRDLMQILPPSEWQTWARQMMDRDLLADDEWWAALQRRRRRFAGRPVRPSDMPSYSTRMTAGSHLMMAHYGRAHEPETDPVADDLHHASGRFRAWDYREAQAVAYQRSGGLCEADGIHHRNCPGDSALHLDQFVTHHIYPREVAKRDGMADDPLVDHPGNLLHLWNGHTRKGAGGCHGRIHTERGLARDLGYLARDLSHVTGG